jgi:hypothetical protein
MVGALIAAPLTPALLADGLVVLVHSDGSGFVPVAHDAVNAAAKAT